MNPDIKYQAINLTVTGPKIEVPIDVATDLMYLYCTGVNVVMNDDKSKFSSLALEINSKEIFAEGWEVLRIKFREQVPFGFEYHGLKEPAAGSRVKGKYKDNGQAATYPYTLSISLRLENELRNYIL